MAFLEIFLIAISLSMDACAVSLGAGAAIRGSSRRSLFRIPFHFGLFQALMPVIGWFVGRTIEPFIASYDHWIAFALLAYVGGRMIRSGLDNKSESFSADPSRGWTLVMLSVATSIDALAVGLSLGLLGVFILTPALVIGLVTWALSLLGMQLGQRLSDRFGKPVEVFGGLILIGIGVRIVITHLLKV